MGVVRDADDDVSAATTGADVKTVGALLATLLEAVVAFFDSDDAA